MKLIKSLLLGSAAGLMAVTGSMAADLPSRKAAPVDYVRTCPGQGVGFFFIPGTENCLRISGRVRADYLFGPSYSRADDSYGIRPSARLNFDLRQSTPIGTVRAFMRLDMARVSGRSAFGFTTNTNRGNSALDTANNASLSQAFIQFGLGGGIVTAGRAPSFFDFYGADAYRNFGGLSGTPGQVANMLAYTANFGGGFTSTLAIEDRGVSNGVGGLTYTGRSFPDLVGNLRISQGWGTAQLMAAMRQVNIDNNTGAILPTVRKNATGYALGAGFSVNLPALGAGSDLYFEGVYAKGMANYTSGDSSLRIRFANVAMNDFATFGTVTRLSESFSLVGALRVAYSPVLSQNIFAGYTSVKYGAGSPSVGALAGNRSFNKYEIGTNFLYTIAPGLNLGVEVVYQMLDPRGSFSFTDAKNVARVANSQNSVEGRFRIQRDF